jgi:hypothetical protein
MFFEIVVILKRNVILYFKRIYFGKTNKCFVNECLWKEITRTSKNRLKMKLSIGFIFNEQQLIVKLLIKN